MGWLSQARITGAIQCSDNYSVLELNTTVFGLDAATFDRHYYGRFTLALTVAVEEDFEDSKKDNIGFVRLQVSKSCLLR